MISEAEIFLQLAALERRFDNQIKPVVPLHLIDETVLAGAAASVTFSSIPQHFRSLLLVCQARTDRVAEFDNILIRFNADSGNNYDYIYMWIRGDGAQGIAGVLAQTSIVTTPTSEAANSRASNWSPSLMYIAGYSETDREKILNLCPSSVYGDVSAITDIYSTIGGGRWRSTNAITSITILPQPGPNFVAGSIFQLYGLA